MAPMVCVPEMSMPRSDAACPYTRRRRSTRAGGIGGKRRSAELRQMSIARVRPESSYSTPPASPLSAPVSPIDACYPNSPEPSLCARIPISEDQWIIAKRRQGLLNIVARTIALVRRNHILEKKVEALRLETRSFISSVLNNPENRAKDTLRESGVCNMDLQVDDAVSISTRETEGGWPAPSSLDETRRKVSSDQTAVTSTCTSPSSSERDTRSPDALVH